MSIVDVLAARLIEDVKSNDLSGSFLMLGRQDWIGARRSASAALFRETLQKYLPGVAEADLCNPDDGYSETFFRKLGFSEVDSLDFSGFEGASIVQDLAGDLPENLAGRFDVIYDGGTCEHVFDLPTAYRNIDKMLKPGGVFIAHSPSNNWINHGFYQICPEIVYGFWVNAMNYEALKCVWQPLRPYAARDVVKMTDPNKTKKRPRPLGTFGPGLPVLLDYVVRKPVAGTKTSASVSQSDYATRWENTQKA